MENPVIVGQSYSLKEGSPDHPLRSGVKPGVNVKVLRSLGSNLFDVQIPEGKTVMVYGDNLDRGSYQEVSVKFVNQPPSDRAYARPELKSDEDTETAIKRLLGQHQDIQSECSNTMVQRLASLLSQYDVMAVAHPGSNAHYFFRYRKP